MKQVSIKAIVNGMILIIIILCCYFFAVTLTGCEFPNKPPPSVVIDGTEYVTDFYGNLYIVGGIRYQDKETSLFEQSNHYWWKLEGADFDFYYALHKDSQTGDIPNAYTVYCPKSRFDEVKNYYENADNFHYYLESSTANKIAIEDVADRNAIESAINYTLKAEKTIKSKQISFDAEAIMNADRLSFFKKSKDGIFGFGKEVIYYQGDLYFFDYYKGTKAYLSVIDKTTNSVLKNLFAKYEIIEND